MTKPILFLSMILMLITSTSVLATSKPPRIPKSIGTYSTAVEAGQLIFLSGQIGLKPDTMTMASKTFDGQARQVFKNIRAITHAEGGSLQDIVKLTVYLATLKDFQQLNLIMTEYFHRPYPARAAVEVKALPKGALLEVDAIMKNRRQV